MANITDNLGWLPVLRPENDLALGGNETGFPGLYFRQLASRDKYLYDQLAAFIGLGDTAAQNSFESLKDLGQAAIAQGRLTLATSDPNPSTDQTARTTIYYTPFSGNQLALWNGTANRWDVYTFTERSASLAGLTANTNHDIFAFDNTGTVTLQAVAWTDSTAGAGSRAQAISLKDGVWVKTSDNRRYLGTIRTTATIGQCEDSQQFRYVWNAQNRLERTIRRNVIGAYSFNSATPREAQNSSGGRVHLIAGLPGTTLSIGAIAGTANQTAAGVYTFRLYQSSADNLIYINANSYVVSGSNVWTILYNIQQRQGYDFYSIWENTTNTYQGNSTNIDGFWSC